MSARSDRSAGSKILLECDLETHRRPAGRPLVLLDQNGLAVDEVKGVFTPSGPPLHTYREGIPEHARERHRRVGQLRSERRACHRERAGGRAEWSPGEDRAEVNRTRECAAHDRQLGAVDRIVELNDAREHATERALTVDEADAVRA